VSARRDLEWADFQVTQVADGFWIRCSCYEARPSGAYRTKVHVASVAEVRQWTHDHSCTYRSMQAAKAHLRRLHRRASD